ncbi:MAG: hypothetical protein IJV06_07165 [Bacteroidaceae bacterium]|nr:hypothetical protein [Bacteroidaceae bacterium]
MEKLYLSLVMMLLPLLAMADNVLKTENISVQPGRQVVLPINLENSDEIRAMGFDLVLPEGVSVAAASMTNRATKHQVTFKEFDDNNNAYKFAVFSMSNNNFTNKSGTIVNVTLNIDKDMAQGNYDIQLKEVEFSVPSTGLNTGADYTSQMTIDVSNRMKMPDIVGGVGFTTTLPISLDNVDNVRAVGFVLHLPEGVSIIEDGAELSSRASRSHQVSYNLVQEGEYRFAILSMGNKNIRNNEGILLTVTLKIADDVVPQDYNITLSNIELSATGEGLKQADDYTAKMTIQTVGDIDGDGQFTLNDITALIELYLSRGL